LINLPDLERLKDAVSKERTSLTGDLFMVSARCTCALTAVVESVGADSYRRRA
jgi:hypothetical protein